MIDCGHKADIDIDDCRALWNAALLQKWRFAMRDLSSVSSASEALDIERMRGWFGTKDFYLHCEAAGRDAEAILAEFNRQKEAGFACKKERAMSENRLDRLVSKYHDDGLSDREMSKVIGCSRYDITRSRHRQGLPAVAVARRAMLAETRRAHVSALHKRGWGYDRIAHELGVSFSTVYADLKSLRMSGQVAS